jgi:hypothetical protein
MPFDLVIDEHTADRQEARVSRNSVAGSWGAVAGNLRFFADRFGVPRAAIEGTTIPYDLVRRYARRSAPEIEVAGSRKQRGLVMRKRLSYFGFELEAVEEPLEGAVDPALRPALVAALAGALLAGETPHPSQGRIRRAGAELGELWRRSGGTLKPAAPEAVRAALAAQLEAVTSWDEFLHARVELDPAQLIAEPDRARLMALPASVRLLGDTVPISYEVSAEGGVARVQLREGQLRRLREEMLPVLDRPLRFAVMRGNHPALQADTLPALMAALRDSADRERRGKFKPPRHRRRH